MKKRVTMKAVAERAGFCQATVSQALRGTGRVAAATRERIRRVAEEMGFREDPMMSALAAYRIGLDGARRASQNIALVVAEEMGYRRSQAADFRAIEEGIAAGAARWGFDLEVLAHDGRRETGLHLSRVLQNRGVRGVILYFPRPSEKEHPRELDWEKFVVVACKPLFSRQIFHSVSTDHFANGRKMYQKLYAGGYRRIGLCFSEALDLVSNRAFKSGFWAEEMAHCAPEDRVPHLILPDWRQERFDEWFRTWEPQVLVTQNWRIYPWLKELGRRIPQDVGVAVPSADKGEFYSGIDPHHKRMGEEAVRLLREQLILGSFGVPELPLNLTIPSTWHTGETLRLAESSRS